MTSSYNEAFGMYWPDYDKQAVRAYDYMIKHQKDIDYAMSICKKRRVAVQAGGHVGVYPKRIARHFGVVHSFEPDDDCFECLVENCSHIYCYNLALGDEEKAGYLKKFNISGWSKIDDAKDGQPIQIMPLDALNIKYVDFICLDLEGHELSALDGARATIDLYKPVIQLEVHDENIDDYTHYMRAINYKEVHQVSKDRVYIHENY